MVAQLRGAKFTGRPPRPDGPSQAEAANNAMTDVAHHLGFDSDRLWYLSGLAALKRAIFDRATRTKWQRTHNG